MSGTRRLILNADDFGADTRVNEAVLRAYERGVLRFASLMVDGEGAAEAAGLARANPGLGVGLHLQLCADRPALWGLRFFLEPGRRAWIASETSRQIEKCLAWGIRPTHIDGHLNIHVHPAVFPLLVDAARRYGIPRLRLPGGELSTSLAFERRGAAGKLLLAAVYGALGSWLRTPDVLIPERTFGLLRSGLMTEDYLVWIIARLPPGLTEVYLHPTSRPGGEEGRASAGHRSVRELEALLSPRVARAIEEGGVSLASAKDFPAARE